MASVCPSGTAYACVLVGWSLEYVRQILSRSDGNGRLTGARTAHIAPYARYFCHLCNSPLLYHPEYQTERPWFEHRHDALTENGRQHCPYVKPEAKKSRHIGQLQWYVPEARPLVHQAD